MPPNSDSRVILFHKQSTSARTRFVRFGHGGVCGPDPLPSGAVPSGADSGAAPATHPGRAVHRLAQEFGLPADGLEPVGEFRRYVSVAGGLIPIFLARFTAIDPPFVAIESAGSAFIDLTQARGLATLELELLRTAYELILGG